MEKIKKRLVSHLSRKYYYDDDSEIYLSSKRDFNKYVLDHASLGRDRRLKITDDKLAEIISELERMYSDVHVLEVYLKKTLYEIVLRKSDDPLVVNTLDKL